MRTIRRKRTLADDIEMRESAEERATRLEKELEKANERIFAVTVESELRARGARNIKAARALIDEEYIKGEKDTALAARREAERLAGAPDTAFLFERPVPTGEKRDVGGRFVTTRGDSLMQAVRRAAGLDRYDTNGGND